MIPAIIVFLFGLLVGSFLNVCIYRMPKSESIVFPASHCPKCGKNILWYDNIPVFSFIFLGGKCRFCKANIHWRYPVVEFATALLLAALFVSFGISAKFFVYSVMTCGLLVATFVDFEIQEIPDEISVGGTVAGILLAFIFPSVFATGSRFHALFSSLAGAFAGGASIYILGVIGKVAFKKEAMGGGDVKLMAMLGSFLGVKLVILTFFMAPFLGVVPGVVLKIKKGAETIPYGPFLSAAALIALFFGEKLLNILFGGLI